MEKTPIVPYLAVHDAAAAIEFYRAAFGADEVYRLQDEQGRVSHAELRIQGAPVYISDEHPEIRVLSPRTIGGSPVMMVIDCPDTDALFQQALAAGASLDRPPQDGFDGTLRTAKLIDPYGHRWMITTRRAG